MDSITAGSLAIAFEAAGPDDGWPVVLLHGFPYDPGSYEAVMPLLAAEGARVIVPYLRGFGPTRFLSAETPRSGQQAAVGFDVLRLTEALQLEAPILVGYDWGGRAACVAAALWPERFGGLVAIGGYSIQDIAGSVEPTSPRDESLDWYQYYFHSERGRRGLAANRRELTAQLWREWAPGRDWVEADFERAAASFDNPDFVDVVIHSYRHRFGLVDGDPAFDHLERALATLPPVTIPTVVLDQGEDPMNTPAPADEHREHLPALVAHRVVAAGHDLPRHAPAAVAEAVLALRAS